MGALFGAVYAVCAFLPGGDFLTQPVVKIMAGILLALIAFGGRRRLLRLTGVFFACACALGGGTLMISLLGSGGLTYPNGIPATSLDLKVLLLSATGIYLLLTLCMRCLGRYSRLKREVVPVTLFLEGRQVKVDGFGGHREYLVRSPQRRQSDGGGVGGGTAAVFRSGDLGGRGTAGTLRLRTEAGTSAGAGAGASAALPGGGRGFGMLLAPRVDGALIDGERIERLLVALCPGRLATNGNYTALIGAEG